MTKSTLILFAFLTFFACKEAPKSTTNTPPTTPEKPADSSALDQAAITNLVSNFYKWYETFSNDKKRDINYLDDKGKATKLDIAKVNTFHAALMKSGFISKVYVANDMAYLKKYEAIWAKDKENNNDGPITGLDFNRVFCGQDWDIKAYTTGTVKVEGLTANQAKATVNNASNLEFVKENGKWLIANIVCK
jgi:hypothetical protein